MSLNGHGQGDRALSTGFVRCRLGVRKPLRCAIQFEFICPTGFGKRCDFSAALGISVGSGLKRRWRIFFRRVPQTAFSGYWRVWASPHYRSSWRTYYWGSEWPAEVSTMRFARKPARPVIDRISTRGVLAEAFPIGFGSTSAKPAAGSISRTWIRRLRRNGVQPPCAMNVT